MTQTGQQPNVDNIFKALGSRGRYQFAHVIVASFILFPACFQLLNNVFIVRKVPHHCAAPSNDSVFWEKYVDIDNVSIAFEQCDIVISSHGKEVERTGCVAGMEYEWPTEYSVASEFDLVCERAALAKLSQTLVIGGQGVGAFLITIFSDRFGRKVAMTGSNLGLLVCGTVVTLAPNYIVFAIFKFLIGGFQQGVLTSFSIYAVELYIRKDRRIGSMYRGMIWAAAAVILPFIAYLLRFHSWRFIQLTLTLFSLLVFFQIWYLDESLRWLLANGKTDAVIKCIKRAARYNKKDVHEVMKVFHDVEQTMDVMIISEPPDQQESLKASDKEEKEETIDVAATKKMTILDLLRTKRLLINAVSIWFAWFTVALGYFAIYMTATSLHGDPYINFALVAVMTFPSVLIYFFGVNRFGRKPSTMLLFGCLGGGLVVAGIAQYLEKYDVDSYSKLTIAGSMVAMMGASGSFTAVFFYTPEMFPTNFRNQAVGISSFMGRFGGMMAPFTSVLADKAVWGPGILIGCCATVVCLLTACVLPETKHRELPQTVEEILAWYKNKKSDKNNKTRQTNGFTQVEN